jgi:hypothetical protein
VAVVVWTTTSCARAESARANRENPPDHLWRAVKEWPWTDEARWRALSEPLTENTVWTRARPDSPDADGIVFFCQHEHESGLVRILHSDGPIGDEAIPPRTRHPLTSTFRVGLPGFEPGTS